jgi:hypothetical protein
MVAASLAMRSSLSGIWNNAAFLEIASALSTLVLIVGAVLEEWPKLKKIGPLATKLIVIRITAFEWCVLKKLVAHSIGAILVVVGIVGELVFETRTFIVEDRETATISKEAGDAKLSALEAANAASRAETSASSLQKQLLFQGPRQNLLMGRCSFVNAVKPFARQKIQIRTNSSGISDPNDVEEMREFVSSIKFLLGRVSKWSISDAQGENGWGVTIAVRRSSSSETRNAANALASAFGECGVADMQGDRPTSEITDAGSTFDREDGPPDTIVLFVGRHPH